MQRVFGILVGDYDFPQLLHFSTIIAYMMFV